MCLTCERLRMKRDHLNELYVSSIETITQSEGLSRTGLDKLEAIAAQAGLDLESAWQELEQHMTVHMGRAVVPSELQASKLTLWPAR
jgi:hypothetical protein